MPRSTRPYAADEIRRWLQVFLTRFFANQFKRSCLPDGPKVGIDQPLAARRLAHAQRRPGERLARMSERRNDKTLPTVTPTGFQGV